MKPLRHGSLFSGIGAAEIAAEMLGWDGELRLPPVSELTPPLPSTRNNSTPDLLLLCKPCD